MSTIPCKKNDELKQKIEKFSEVLMTEAHKIGADVHGFDEQEFYDSGLFRGVIEKIRGQWAASTSEKKKFARHILNHMQDKGFIQEWEHAGSKNRHDYSVRLNSGRIAIIEAKGCLDGNNITIFERPPQAEEFIIWSICTNRSSDPEKGAWSGIHTRLGAEISAKSILVDGVIIWDMLCGSATRPCPKKIADSTRTTTVSSFSLPPPCIYVLPSTAPHVRTNPEPKAQKLEDVELLKAFHDCFKGRKEEVNYVDYAVSHRGSDTVRRTCVTRGGVEQKKSKLTPIRRV